MLQRLCRDLLILVLQYLTARHKLAAISRLSRAFYPLPALAFQHDSLLGALHSFTRVAYISSAEGPGRFPMLSVLEPEEPGWSTPFTCPRSLRSLPEWSRLKQLMIRFYLPANADWTMSVGCVLRSALSCRRW
jgi:hypothetical protein